MTNWHERHGVTRFSAFSRETYLGVQILYRFDDKAGHWTYAVEFSPRDTVRGTGTENKSSVEQAAHRIVAARRGAKALGGGNGAA